MINKTRLDLEKRRNVTYLRKYNERVKDDTTKFAKKRIIFYKLGCETNRQLVPRIRRVVVHVCRLARAKNVNNNIRLFQIVQRQAISEEVCKHRAESKYSSSDELKR